MVGNQSIFMDNNKYPVVDVYLGMRKQKVNYSFILATARSGQRRLNQLD